MCQIAVQTADFDPGVEIAALSALDAPVGGVASFVGVVRGGEVAAMTLEHYPGMTERQLTAIAEEALARWPLLGVRILHRHGRLLPGARIVFCGVAARHRAEAFEACAFLVDWLKTRAPFWKLEETATGERWVEAREEDEAARARWEG